MKYVHELIYSARPGIRILRHVLFWTTDIVSYLSVISVTREITPSEVYIIILKMIPIILTTYFILYYLIPNFSTLNSQGTFLLWFLIIFIMIGVGMRLYNHFVINPIFEIVVRTSSHLLDVRPILGQAFSYMAVICMAITIKLVKNKTQLEQSNKKLLEEKKKTELSFLRAQMQPHFLFNTLNTLYSETIQDSGLGQQVVLHLSNLLRFILDECNKPLIRFEDEIKVINDFIALEQLRHGSRLQVNLVVKPVDRGSMISPLVFLPFVENSFKHTLTKLRGKIIIDIEIDMIDGYYVLKVENGRANNHNGLPIQPNGNGISNIQRQLDLVYGKDYSLVLNGAHDKFQVALKIPVRPSLNYVEN